MRSYEVFKTIHILAVVIWLGGGILLLLLGERARRAGPERQEALLDEMTFLGARFFPVASGVALLSGIALVVDLDGVGFGDLWVTLAMVGWLVSALTGAVFTDRAVKARDLARATTIARIDVAILMLVVIDMVFKPG